MKRQLTNEPLYGVAVYNPGILSKQELIRLFVARRVLLQQIIDDLNRENPKGIPQHRLLVGARGMGKTTLLRRIAYAVEDDEKLSSDWLPLTFPEEQYNVARLSDLWLNCLDAVSDALERQGKHDEAEALDKIIDALPDDKEEERARKALNTLLEQAQKTGQRLLLLFDNIDLIFERLAKEHWTIREMLSKEGAPLLIGATSRPLEPTYEYQGAFYDFFKISNLNKLQLDEMHEVLRTLAEELNAPQVSQLLEQDPARIRVLYDLTGGNPRTTVLLFSVLAQGIDGDVRSDLERLLDQCTPLYKARFEELSSQAQQVVDALAIHWDPAPAVMVAERARLEVNNVSSHLNRLSEQGIVEKVRLYPKKKTGFQIAERFFNIWYLMRASRRMRRKLIWLSKFLKSFYSQEDLHNLARRYLSKELSSDATSLLKHAEYGFALAEALDDKGWRRALEHTASQITFEIQDKFREILGDSAIALEELDKNTLNMKQKRDKLLQAKIKWNGIDKREFCELFFGCPDTAIFSIAKFVGVAEKATSKNIKGICKILNEAKKELQDFFRDNSLVDNIYQAICAGLMESWTDVEGAESAMHVLGAPLIKTVALGKRLEERQDKDSYRIFKEHLEKTQCECLWAWKWLGNAEITMGFYAEAEKAYRKALSYLSNDPGLWFKLSTLLGDHLKNAEGAEQALGRAIELAPDNAGYLNNLGLIQWDSKKIAEAEETFRKAILIDPRLPILWSNLGGVLGEKKQFIESETAYKTSIKLNAKEAGAWTGLGIIQLLANNNFKQAEKYFRKVTELDPKNINAWFNLALLLENVSRYPEAEQAYLHVVQLKPDDLSFTLKLASISAINGKWQEAATYATPVLQSDSECTVDLLGDILSFFKSAASAGFTKEAITLLEQSELDDSWRPVMEALKAIQAGTPDYFFNIAPEVRGAAEEIYKMMMSNGDEA
jgi:Flp pilus assembly protein TadD/DNA-binding transcriptional ArsR family regulator